MIDHRNYIYNLITVVKLNSENRSGLNGIRAHEIRNTGIMLNLSPKLSSQQGTGDIVSLYMAESFFFFSGFNFTAI